MSEYIDYLGDVIDRIKNAKVPKSNILCRIVESEQVKYNFWKEYPTVEQWRELMKATENLIRVAEEKGVRLPLWKKRRG